jgi:hypothetical protein
VRDVPVGCVPPLPGVLDVGIDGIEGVGIDDPAPPLFVPLARFSGALCP